MWNKSKTLLVPATDQEAKFFFCPEGYPIRDDLPIKPQAKAIPAAVKPARKDE